MKQCLHYIHPTLSGDERRQWYYEKPQNVLPDLSPLLAPLFPVSLGLLERPLVALEVVRDVAERNPPPVELLVQLEQPALDAQVFRHQLGKTLVKLVTQNVR